MLLRLLAEEKAKKVRDEVAPELRQSPAMICT